MISLLGTEAAVAESGDLPSLVGRDHSSLRLDDDLWLLGSGGQQSTYSYVCEPVDQSIKRSVLPL